MDNNKTQSNGGCWLTNFLNKVAQKNKMRDELDNNIIIKCKKKEKKADSLKIHPSHKQNLEI